MSGEQVVVVMTAIPEYRQAWIDELCARLGDDIVFLHGPEHFAPVLVTAVEPRPQLRDVRNSYIFRRKFLWQRGVLRPGVAAGIAVMEFNPHILSNWVLLLARRLRRRRSVLWGHAWSRSGRESRSNPLRLLMCRCADAVVVYTESGRSGLAEMLPSRPVYTAPNAIDAAADMQPAAPAADASSFIYSGRLVPDKKPSLALQAFARAVDRLSAGAKLIFVGDGPLQHELQREARDLGVEQRVEFAGRIFELDRLRELYARSVASLSPGYVGLSMTQSHAFGLPMIYASDEPHAPEIEAAREGVNAFELPSDDPEAFAAAMITVAGDRDEWLARRDEISAECRGRYSVEAMADGFLAATFGTSAAATGPAAASGSSAAGP